jgi:hypothetical protein
MVAPSASVAEDALRSCSAGMRALTAAVVAAVARAMADCVGSSPDSGPRCFATTGSGGGSMSGCCTNVCCCCGVCGAIGADGDELTRAGGSGCSNTKLTVSDEAPCCRWSSLGS